MQNFSFEQLAEFLAASEPPCISLYQPTHRHHPENQQDPVRFRNLVREMEATLRERYPAQDIQALVAQFQALSQDIDFWNHRTDGLAILGSAGKFQIFELQRPVKALLVVEDSFHVKPLLRILQSADRFQILCLNRHEAKLYEGNRDTLDPVDLTGVPATITEALGKELSEPHQTVASYGMGAGKGGKEMRHGHGGKKDEVDIDMDRFFRVIDRAILEHHSRRSELPLMLAALPEYHAPFRAVSHNPFLMAEGLTINPEPLSLDALRTQAWQKVEPLYLARLAGLVENYQTAKSRQLGSEDLTQVAQAIKAGRVGTLLVEADREIPGRFDAASGQLEPGSTHPEVGDMLDDLAEATLRMKGEVVIVPAERMPGTTGVAATYRY